ncbi:MAG: hypothetical protein HW421_3049 [Ignavibacteria bacterium]|nr:hypothetical protein [Ignavibacteria bacterium]
MNFSKTSSNLTFVILSFFLLFFTSCTTTRTVGDLSYQLQCLNCGVTIDGILKVELMTIVEGDNPIVLKITNLKNDMVLLDERLFAMSADSEVVMSPIALYNPNITVSMNYSTSVTDSKTSPYLFGNNRLDFYTTQYGSNQSTSLNENPQPYFVIPAQMKLKYKISNYYNSIFTRLSINRNYRIYIQGGHEYIMDWDKLGNDMNKFINKELTFTIVYKLLNEDKWRSLNIIANPINYHLEKRTIKE